MIKQRLFSIGFALITLFGFFTLCGSGYHSYHNEKNVFYGNPNNYSKIALTFDDGPEEGSTDEILDILKEYGIKATFFVIGEQAERNPQLLQREAEEGHEIGDHTYTHLYMKNESLYKIDKEWNKTQSIIESQTDTRVRLCRPPGGYYSDAIARSAEMRDYAVVLWTIDTRDWSGCSADAITQEVIENAECGDIILMHDGSGRKLNTAQALRQIIPVLLERGFKFVTVSELIGGS
jgi:peptidoglycan/xylan/chitin deacetylase (PgdA/CDA1 family)